MELGKQLILLWKSFFIFTVRSFSGMIVGFAVGIPAAPDPGIYEVSVLETFAFLPIGCTKFGCMNTNASSPLKSSFVPGINFLLRLSKIRDLIDLVIRSVLGPSLGFYIKFYPS